MIYEYIFKDGYIHSSRKTRDCFALIVHPIKKHIKKHVFLSS